MKFKVMFLVALGVCVGLNVHAGDYVANANGTVTDKDTGLTWQKDGSSVGMPVGDAFNYCNNLTVGGYDDWRLPDVKELKTLADATTQAPSINTLYFTRAGTAVEYWSSTVDADYKYSQWYVSFRDGLVGRISASVNNYVRCVR